MPTYSLSCSKEAVAKIMESFKEDRRPSKNPYIAFEAKAENCIISVYTSGKVVFQGKDAAIYASAFDPAVLVEKTREDIFPQAGSDEVGTGDYFGCICVCACLLDEKNTELLKQFKIQDSKQCTDEQICEIAPHLIQAVPHSLLILDNKKYNEIHPFNNMNQIKAILHNQAYIHLKKKCGTLPSLCVVDQFAPSEQYYRYLKNQRAVITNLKFEIKAENKYPAVACASIIARYAFLKNWEAMEKKYEMSFTKGASSRCDEDGVRFIKRYGSEALNEVAKLHFKNTDKITELLQKE